MVTVSDDKTGWDAWSQSQADAARAQHDFRLQRLQREKQENEARLFAKALEKQRIIQEKIASSPDEAAEQARKKAILAAAIERAKARK
jgi:electron transport complex protein RnfB